MNAGKVFVKRYIIPSLQFLDTNPYLSSVRSGMVAIVPPLIIGSLFILIANFPVPGWNAIIAPYLPLLKIPVSATYGLISVYVCLAISYDLGRLKGDDPLSCAIIAVLIFLMIHLVPAGTSGDYTLSMESLGSIGMFTAIIIALVTVPVKIFLTNKKLVIRMPESVPPAVQESFRSLTPLFLLIIIFWLIRFVLNIAIDDIVQAIFHPLVFALDTLPGILFYAFIVTILWSVGINGDNTMDSIVAPIFLMYLTANVEAISSGQPLPYITASGFFSTFVNIGGTGATLALAFLMFRSKDPGYREVSRLSLPAQCFSINEPIFFGFPIVMNPVFMVPFIISTLALTTGTFLLMDFGMISRPFIDVPWTTPPVIAHYLVTGGDIRAAIWGLMSIGIAMIIYYPFARHAEKQRTNSDKEMDRADIICQPDNV